MLFTRTSYDPEEEWKRLIRVGDSLRAVMLKEGPLKIPRSAGVTRLRQHLDELGATAAERVRRRTFEEFGERGDKEVVRPFPLQELPSRAPVPFDGLPTYPANIALSLAFGDEDDELGERWYLVRRSDDGDSVRLLRERTRIERFFDEAIGQERRQERIERVEFDLRLDRRRRALFVAGPSRTGANKLARAFAAHLVSAGILVTLGDLPQLNIGVIQATIDSFGAGPRLTNISPSDQELQPLRHVGTRTTDLNQHPDVRFLIRLGEQTALAAEFDRVALGATNTCPVRAMIEIDINWTLTPGTFVEAPMVLALYDRLKDFSTSGRLLVPIAKQVEMRVRARYGARLTPARQEGTLATIVTDLSALDVPDRPDELPAARLQDTVVLGIILAVADCAKLRSARTQRRLHSRSFESIVGELLPSVSARERDRVRAVLEEFVGEGSGYRQLMKRAEKALIEVGC